MLFIVSNILSKTNMFVEQTIRMLKNFGQRPGVRKTFRFSSRTPHALKIFFYELYIYIYYFCNLNFNHEIKEKKTKRKLTMKLT